MLFQGTRYDELTLAQLQEDRGLIIKNSAYYAAEHEVLFLYIINKFESKIPLSIFLEEWITGYHAGTSAFWWLAQAAANKHAKPFLAFLSYYGDHLPIEAFLTEPQNRPGQTVCWLLTQAAVLGDRKAFSIFWKKYFDKLPHKSLWLLVGGQRFKDTSPLYYLAENALLGDEDPLEEAWEKIKGEIPVKFLMPVFTKFIALTVKGKAKYLSSLQRRLSDEGFSNALLKEDVNGETPLLHLVANANNKTIANFLKSVWLHIKPKLTLDILTSPVRKGSYCGATLLWFLARMYHQGFPEYFLDVCGSNLKPNEFDWLMLILKENKFQNVVPLHWIVEAALNSKQDAFVLILSKLSGEKRDALLRIDVHEASLFQAFVIKKDLTCRSITAEGWSAVKESLTIEKVIYQVKQGDFKGHSLVWHTSYLFGEGMTEPFEYIWKKYNNKIPTTLLLDDNINLDGSLLWWLTKGLIKKEVAYLLPDIWNRIKNTIMATELLEVFKANEVDQGSVFLFLTKAILQARLPLFNELWRKVKDEITKDALLEDLLWCVAYHARHDVEPFMLVWEKLGQVISSEHLLTEFRTPSSGKLRTTLGLLLYAAVKDGAKLIPIITEILGRNPGIVAPDSREHRLLDELRLESLVKKVANCKF